MINSSKPRILIIVDRPGWAHDHKTGNLQRTLGEKYEIIKRYQAEVNEADLQEADLIQVYYWLQVPRMERLEQAFLKNLNKLLIGVCEHIEFKDDWFEPGVAWLKKASVVFVNSQLLYQFVRPLLDGPVFYTPNGVDTNFFSPPISKAKSPVFKVGWSGSLLNHGSEHRGYDNFIVPATQAMENVELVTAIREDRWRSHQEMIDFYHSIDVYLCASRSEGTPNTCLEAAACGVPVVTTRVGNMPELIKPGINGYFIERDIADIQRVLAILRDDKDHRRQLGQAIRDSALDWDWSLLAENYHDLYQYALAKPSGKPFQTLNEEKHLNQLRSKLV